MIEPDDGVLAIGSGGNYALAAARALMENTDSARRAKSPKSALHIAADHLRLYQRQHHRRDRIKEIDA